MSIPILSSLAVRRFRSFPQDVVKFANPTFLVGQNGSGKSNFVDVFAFLAEAMAAPLQTVFDRRGGFAAVGNRSSARGRPSNLGLKATLRNLSGEANHGQYAFELRALKNYGFEVVREQCVITKVDGSRNWFDREGSAFRSDAESLEPAAETNALALPLIGGDVRFRPVLRFLANMQTCRIEPAVLREMQERDGGARLRADGGNTASVLREIRRESPQGWSRIIELLNSIVPGTIDVKPKRHGNKLTLEFAQDWQKSEPVRFESFSMSDGTLRALGLLTAVFQTPPPSVLVIEEPEATIHPGAMGAILDVMRHAGRFMQVVVTTHSPDVLDADWIADQHLRVVSWERGASRVTPVSEAVRAAVRDHLIGAGELLRSNALTSEELFEPRLEQGQGELFATDLQ
ncbi:MAG: AAA family ATPase [Spirochaetaceae bacterium]|nr:AAA family ATPase [Spirochaetaceae bacterium]